MRICAADGCKHALEERDYGGIIRKNMEKIIHIEDFERKDVSRQRTFEIFDEIENSLSKPENYKIIDEVLLRDGASYELGEKIIRCSEKLKNEKKPINEKNSAIDVLENLQTCLFAFVERVKKKGIYELAQKNIADKIRALNNYFDLLINWREFTNAEFGNEDGYLGYLVKNETDVEKRKEFMEIRADKVKYVDFCKEILDKKAAAGV